MNPINLVTFFLFFSLSLGGLDKIFFSNGNLLFKDNGVSDKIWVSFFSRVKFENLQPFSSNSSSLEKVLEAICSDSSLNYPIHRHIPQDKFARSSQGYLFNFQNESEKFYHSRILAENFPKVIDLHAMRSIALPINSLIYYCLEIENLSEIRSCIVGPFYLTIEEYLIQDLSISQDKLLESFRQIKEILLELKNSFVVSEDAGVVKLDNVVVVVTKNQNDLELKILVPLLFGKNISSILEEYEDWTMKMFMKSPFSLDDVDFVNLLKVDDNSVAMGLPLDCNLNSTCIINDEDCNSMINANGSLEMQNVPKRHLEESHLLKSSKKKALEV